MFIQIDVPLFDAQTISIITTFVSDVETEMALLFMQWPGFKAVRFENIIFAQFLFSTITRTICQAVARLKTIRVILSSVFPFHNLIKMREIGG